MFHHSGNDQTPLLGNDFAVPGPHIIIALLGGGSRVLPSLNRSSASEKWFVRRPIDSPAAQESLRIRRVPDQHRHNASDDRSVVHPFETPWLIRYCNTRANLPHLFGSAHSSELMRHETLRPQLGPVSLYA